MSEIWIAVILCIVVILSGALPLLRDRHHERTLPPPRETLRDWRKEEGTLDDWRNKGDKE